MAVDTASMFAQVIQEHLELKRRNSALEHEMPLEQYLTDDPFENHPLFKTEEQARFEDTMDGVQGIEAEETHLDWPTTDDTFIAPHRSSIPDATVEAVLPEAADPTSRPTRTSGRARGTSTGATRPSGRHRRNSRAQRLSSILFTGQKVAEPPKSSAPAANTFAPSGVS